MSSASCCVPACTVRIAQGVPLHGFPKPHSQRFQTWIMNIGGEILTLSYPYIFQNRRVCHRHFDAAYICSNNRLSKLAVPTLQISGVQSDAQVPSDEIEIPRPVTHQPRGSDIKSLNAEKVMKLRKQISILKMKLTKLTKRKNSFKQSLSIALENSF